jgi:hypothetical protein
VDGSRVCLAREGYRAVSRVRFVARLDALLALKADEAFAGSCDPETAADRRAVFRQAREDFIREFGGSE